MRVLFASFGAPSHFYPMVPLAWALRAAGAEVWVFHPPEFADTVAAAGLPSCSVGRPRQGWGAPPARQPSADAGEWERRRSLRAVTNFVRVAEGMARDAVELARRFRPDLVVFEPRAYAGLLAARVAAVPAIRHLYGTDYTFGRQELERPVLEPFLHDHGLTVDDVAGALTIDPCPPALQWPTTSRRRLMRYVPYNGAGTEPGWLRRWGRRPRLCVTWGTTTARFLDHLAPVHSVLTAVSDLDVEVVVAVRSADRRFLGDVPPGVRVAEDVPLHLLLPSCGGVVHHGGAGTTITSLMSAVPQLVLPSIADQFGNGERVRDCGVGLCLPPRAATVPGIRAAVVELLARPGYRVAARRAAAEALRQPPPARVAAGLVELVRAASSPRRPGHHPGLGGWSA
jgi:UDP:flavonoid glycosyltransferase YjiC (YdhE family)